MKFLGLEILCFTVVFLVGPCLTQEVEVEDEPTLAVATVAPTPTATPAATVEATPTRPLAPGCTDCPVKAEAQIKVTAADIQVGKDGRFYVPDRGDGCEYLQPVLASETIGPGGAALPGRVSLWALGCELGWDYEPSTGTVHPLIP
jgi:hypothetical protein